MTSKKKVINSYKESILPDGSFLLSFEISKSLKQMFLMAAELDERITVKDLLYQAEFHKKLDIKEALLSAFIYKSISDYVITKPKKRKSNAKKRKI